MKYIYIDKSTKKIKFFSDVKLDLPQFEEAQTNDDLSGNICYYKDKKVVKEKIKQLKEKKLILEEIENATTIKQLKYFIINNLL